ncbi:MAG TPA: hypothetical protein PKD85_20950, partial [Saprospiraceae bacterium]|nr:hypothetical protein [Saprospiraceae bacterium]
YLNHMDPLEAIPTIFFRKILNVPQGDSNHIGATLCMWHDRSVSKEDDILIMNPVYPGMLTFAERIWQGGGHEKWTAKINNQDPKDLEDFTAFENRLIDHKNQYFKNKPFPYVVQSHMHWNLYGPFFNQGDIDAQFLPELDTTYFSKTSPHSTAIGGTIVLRHWWAPLIEGHLPQPQDSTTWYASTKIWSEEDKNINAWVGFYNISRSQASNSPPLGQWDSKGSKIWCNHQEILPPKWLRPDQKGHLEIPLMDEGYEFRTPTLIPLMKGWNTITIKVPIKSFVAKDWNNPVKWMFTFLPLE